MLIEILVDWPYPCPVKLSTVPSLSMNAEDSYKANFIVKRTMRFALSSLCILRVSSLPSLPPYPPWSLSSSIPLPTNNLQ